jgi:Glycosyl hydrolases family 2, sugar binding domain/Glycosyl hydrolases family 2/Glycosyl hydrolases family 2, TIM barrel domain
MVVAIVLGLVALYCLLGLVLHYYPEQLAKRVNPDVDDNEPFFGADHSSSDWDLWFESQGVQWQAAETPLLTTWGENLDTGQVLPEYPRPQLQRDHWKNLNGLWSFNVVPREVENVQSFPGTILVPFALESPLSGVGRPLFAGERLWYQRTFSVPESWKSNNNILLHFGAVDYQAEVFVNDIKVGEHRGGYTPFYFDISSALSESGDNELVVAVRDPSNAHGATQQRGKQHLKPDNVFYTATSGIWQTVWLEPVAKTSISDIQISTDISTGSAAVALELSGDATGLLVDVMVEGEPIVSNSSPTEPTTINLQNVELWSPDNPHLYPLTVTLRDGDEKIDTVKSYFALREVGKIELNGHSVFTLNGKPIFHYGPLDQGYWSDGEMTPPSDEALIYDLELIKAMGMNTVRKHIKVEPARFYYHADRLGLMVWQDMPNGGNRVMPSDNFVQILHMGLPFGVTESKRDFIDNRYESWGRDETSRRHFEEELVDVIDSLRFFPSIVMWVPFNEYWGQFDATRIAEKVEDYDPTRLVNHASGWVDQGAGDVYDRHVYDNYHRIKGYKDPRGDRVGVLGEFGGKTLAVKDHLWTDEVFGYGDVEDQDALLSAYTDLLESHVIPGIERGLGAGIYTQLSDIEREINGLVTYDRKVEKFSRKQLRDLHNQLYSAFEQRHAKTKPPTGE